MTSRITTRGLTVESTLIAAVRVTTRGLSVEAAGALSGARVTTRGIMVEWQYTRTVLSLQLINAPGITPAFVPANPEGYWIPNERNQGVFVGVRNLSASSINVLVHCAMWADGLEPGPRTVAVPAGAERWIGMLGAVYNEFGDRVKIDFSGVENVWAAAARVQAEYP